MYDNGFDGFLFNVGIQARNLQRTYCGAKMAGYKVLVTVFD